MKTITIKSLKLINFKGIKNLEITEFGKETKIFGDNATGKTTVFDAFTWLLFGKDSTDRTTFEIKTLDANNNVIPKIDHEVEVEIEVDFETINIKRTLREKWVKKKGNLESEFAGNETNYEWNGVPTTQRDFNLKISTIVNENIFKLITSPTAFNSLKWQDQRQVLIDISGGVTDQSISEGNEDFLNLLSKLTNKSIEEYQQQIKASIAKAKKELKTIPTRIDEVDRSKPEALNFETIELELKDADEIKQSIEKQISNKLEAQKEFLQQKSTIQTSIHKLESKIEDEKHKVKLEAKKQYNSQKSISNDIQSKIEVKTEEITKAKKTLERIDSSIELTKSEIKALTEANDKVRAEWHKVNSSEFVMDESSCKCPTCKRDLESDDIEAKRQEFLDNFQKDKSNKLQLLTAKGGANKKAIKEFNDELSKLESRRKQGTSIDADLIEDLTELHSALESSEDNEDVKTEAEISNEMIEGSSLISSANKDLRQLKNDLEEVKPVDVSELKKKKDGVVIAIDNLKKELSAKDQITKANKRIEELSKEESEMSQTIADYERDQFVIENFIKAKIDKLEGKINEMFELVNFKLFDIQVNGAQVETCQALIDGVPFSDANTASKINAGIDIINTLSNHYEVSAPIFIDNRESVVSLIESNSQIINLIVSEADKKLRIESNVEQLETI